MKVYSVFAAFLTIAVAAHAAVPAPSEFLKFELGSDRQLADYRQIVSYFRALDDASPRVAVETIGKTTLGEDMIMAIISAEENVRNLEQIRRDAARLANPRGIGDAEIERLIREGKTLVLVTCNIHSTEIASSQMAMEWAHALAAATDADALRRLNDVVLLLVPSLNPDGQIMEVEWYRKHLGTPYEGGRMPWLYHHYVGHDNNRDWFMLTQKETRNLSRAIYHRWFPQLFVDEHQMGSEGPRMFIPPFSDPVDPDVHPLIWREVNLIGSNMALRLEQAGKSGLIYGYSYDAYWIGGTRNTGWWKNITGLLLEIASARMATPVFIEPTELEGGRKGLLDYHAQINHPNPWPGGWWRMRDIMDYERIASDALLEIASRYREDVLRNLVTRARAAVASAQPREAYRIWSSDGAAARRLAELMADHGVEVFEGGSNNFWIPLAQPYAKFVREMMEVQRYPEVRVARGEILRPYDVAAWTLPLMMGARSELATMPEGPLSRLTPPIVSDRVSAPVRLASPGGKQPRVGVYKPWTASIDEGWTRYVLEQHGGFRVVSLDNQAVRAGTLRARFDAIILPDLDKEIIEKGRRSSGDSEMKYAAELPPEYRGGIGEEGEKALENFVRSGGTLIAWDSSAEYVISKFNVPVRNVLASVGTNDFESPGSLLRVRLRTDHPVTRGLPAELPVFVDDNIAFDTTLPGAEMQRWVLASFPADSRDILMSGWIHGVERLARRSAVVAMTYGEGKIVLFAFRPQHRGQMQVTFPLLFNALYWSVN